MRTHINEIFRGNGDGILKKYKIYTFFTSQYITHEQVAAAAAAAAAIKIE